MDSASFNFGSESFSVRPDGCAVLEDRGDVPSSALCWRHHWENSRFLKETPLARPSCIFERRLVAEIFRNCGLLKGEMLTRDQAY